jgi:hypothetical protein
VRCAAATKLAWAVYVGDMSVPIRDRLVLI